MHPAQWRLINARYLEAIPAELAQARGNASARRLAQSDWLIRRKADGRFLALRRGDRIHELFRGALPHALLADLAALAESDARPGSARPLSGLPDSLRALGLDGNYADSTGMPLVAEPTVLDHAGSDRYGRPLWLARDAADAWRSLRSAARQDSIELEAISGYRSHDYQLGIFRRKLARGQTLAEILTVNAAPGFSEHHSGNALDIGTPGEPAAEESFESTPAFDWLRARAAGFGFRMSYPRDNPLGIVYEPWHWCWQRG